MKLGFTGTQQGMTVDQLVKFNMLVERIDPSEFHHGDCVGADMEAVHAIQDRKGVEVHSHIPDNNKKRAFTKADVIKKPKPYIARNHDIVDASDIIIATPKENKEQRRSGTWATIRYAKKQCKRMYIIYPNGNIEMIIY